MNSNPNNDLNPALQQTDVSGWQEPKNQLPELGQKVVLLFKSGSTAHDSYKVENADWYRHYVEYWVLSPA